MSMPTAAAHWFPKSPTWRSVQGLSCATCTSRSPALKISFCTTLEGVCASEPQDIFGHARARCPGGAPQFRSTVVADLFAAPDVRVYFWPRDGWQRLHAARVQEPAASRHYGAQHGRHGHLGGGDAADFGISIYPRDRRPAAGTDGDILAGSGESGLRHDAGARR